MKINAVGSSTDDSFWCCLNQPKVRNHIQSKNKCPDNHTYKTNNKPCISIDTCNSLENSTIVDLQWLGTNYTRIVWGNSTRQIFSRIISLCTPQEESATAWSIVVSNDGLLGVCLKPLWCLTFSWFPHHGAVYVKFSLQTVAYVLFGYPRRRVRSIFPHDSVKTLFVHELHSCQPFCIVPPIDRVVRPTRDVWVIVL